MTLLCFSLTVFRHIMSSNASESQCHFDIYSDSRQIKITNIWAYSLKNFVKKCPLNKKMELQDIYYNKSEYVETVSKSIKLCNFSSNISIKVYLIVFRHLGIK